MGALAVRLDGGAEVCFEFVKERENVFLTAGWKFSLGEVAVGVD